MQAGADATAGPAKTLAEIVRDKIETEIVEGQIKPGDKLDEVVLAARLHASRTPVREALRALAAAGLVNIRPRIGATVDRPTVSQVIELFEVVAELEGVAARLATERGDDAARAVIAAAHDACTRAARFGAADAYYAANSVFHHAIWMAAGNQTLTAQIIATNKRLSPYRRFITFRPGRTQTALAEHETIARAIQTRAGEAAAQAMRAHVRILGDDALNMARNLRL